MRASTMLLCSAVLPFAHARQGTEAATSVDVDWIVSGLARPTPMRTSFVEIRESRLLKTPLRLSGEYLRPDAATLVREVRAPYQETTTIVTGKTGPGQATLVRGGKTRSFSLARVPELAAMQASFGALLSGDRAQMEARYTLRSSGTRQRWSLLLTPTDKAMAAKIRDITLHGRGSELRCIETRPGQGDDIQRTLLASAARAVEAGSDIVALCHGGEH